MVFRRLSAIAAVLGMIAFAAPASADTLYCFCKMPSTSQYGTCGGKDTRLPGTVGTTADCSAQCASDGLTYDAAVPDYNAETAPCDYQYQGSCLGPNKNQTSAKCVAERTAYQNNGSGAKDQALTTTQKGSTISLTLPFADVSPQVVIGRIIKAILGIVGSIAFVMFLYGGFRWMVARGNAEDVKKAKQTIIWATLGLIAIFGSYAVVSTFIKGVSGQ